MAEINRLSKSFKKGKIALSSISMSDGKFQSIGTTPKRYVTERATSTLQKRGLMPEINMRSSTDRMAFEMMHAVGYTVEVGQQNLTLIDDSPDKVSEVSLNYTTPDMNILEQNINIMQSFPSECDPIYQMDDNLPDSMQEVGNFIPLKMAETLDLVSSGYSIGNVGMQVTPAGTTSRYFNNQQVSSVVKGLKS
jgi:hypothetical protein